MAKFDMESLISGGKVSRLDTAGTTVERLPLDRIRPNPHNFYNATSGIGDLAESIQANGLLEPLLVRPDGDNYRIISGHRRYNALRNMAELEVAYDYDAIECIVDRAPMTSAQETVKLIEANRQRVKTAYEVATEAERLTAAYVARKVAGETLPGKVRDMVARDMELSASKLARLKVIKDGLTLPGFVEAFEKDKMSESVAYEIAKLPSDEQYRVLDLSIERGEPVSLDLVKRYNFLKLKKSTCNRCEGDHPCNIGNIQYDHFYRYGNVTGCAGCCKRCTSTDSCSYVCEICRSTPEAVLPSTLEKAFSARDMFEVHNQITEIFPGRLKQARKDAMLGKKELARLVGANDGTYSSWENASLPGTGWIPLLAKALKVSADYLLGLTDKPDPSAAPDGWHRLNEDNLPDAGDLVVMGYVSDEGNQYTIFRYCGGTDFESFGFDDYGSEAFTTYEFWRKVGDYEKGGLAK